MEAEFMTPVVLRKGDDEGVTANVVGSNVELTGAVVVGGNQKTAKVTLQVDARDAVDFFDPDEMYTVTFTKNV